MPMLPIHFQFLTAVLGNDGAEALQKASDRSEELGNALMPRSILAWLNAATKYDYEGQVPGIENTYVNFSKSENGFSGSIDLHGERYSFKDASVFHLAAAVATSLDVSDEALTGIRNTEIEKLGKSVDLLAKAKILSDEMAKVEHNKETCTIKDCKICAQDLEKNRPSHHGASRMGGAAAPIEPRAPLPPTATAPRPPMTMAKLPRLPGSAQPVKPPTTIKSTIVMSKAESECKCSMCGQAQFKDGDFYGCICMRALAKSVKAIANLDEFGYILKLGTDWGKDEVLTLFECIGRIK